MATMRDKGILSESIEVKDHKPIEIPVSREMIGMLTSGWSEPVQVMLVDRPDGKGVELVFRSLEGSTCVTKGHVKQGYFVPET